MIQVYATSSIVSHYTIYIYELINQNVLLTIKYNLYACTIDHVHMLLICYIILHLKIACLHMLNLYVYFKCFTTVSSKQNKAADQWFTCHIRDLWFNFHSIRLCHRCWKISRANFDRNIQTLDFGSQIFDSTPIVNSP